MTLEKDGINIFSMLNVFKETVEDVYIDDVHFNDFGKVIFINKIIDIISNKWGFLKKTNKKSNLQ